MHFSEEALIQCGFDLAEALQIPPPSFELFQSKVQEILVDRENYEGALNGLITQEEAAYLMLQHFQTLICRNSGKDESTITTGFGSLVPSTIQALFIQ